MRRLTYPNGKNVTRTFDGDGSLTGVTGWFGGANTFGYDGGGRLATGAAADLVSSGGRRDQICRIAACKPAELRLPFTTWGLTKLVDHLAEHAWIRASTETVRPLLREEGVSWQATKTWKASRDPDFVAKKTRIFDLYDHPPADGRVICVDEFGPLNLQPRPGRGVVPTHPAGPAARNLHPHPRGPADVRRARPGYWADVLPVP